MSDCLPRTEVMRREALRAALLDAVWAMRLQMLSDDATDAPFNEDMADAIRIAEEALNV